METAILEHVPHGLQEKIADAKKKTRTKLDLPYSCHLCNKGCKDEPQLIAHVRQKHPKNGWALWDMIGDLGDPFANSAMRGMLEHSGMSATNKDAEFAQVFPNILALDDMARRFGRTPFSFWTSYAVIEAVINQIHRTVSAAVAVLPAGHEATLIIRQKVWPMLDALRDYILSADNGDGGYGTRKATLGAGMLALVQGIGREVENAAKTCGVGVIGCPGYLDGSIGDPAAAP